MRDSSRPFLVIGHRGAPAVAVENTLAAFERALSEGANGLEVDLCLTRDGHVVVWHDWEPSSAVALARQIGAEPNVMARPVVPALTSAHRRPVDELTLAELREHLGYAVEGERVEVAIPTLDELLAWSTGARGLQCVLFDLKLPASKAHLTEALVGAVTRRIAERRVSFEHVLLTPHAEIYDRASPLVPGDALSFDVDPAIVLLDTMGREDASSARAVARGAGHASTVMPKGIPSQAWSALARLVGFDIEARERSGGRVPTRVLAATIDDRARMEELVALGIDGIVTDVPAVLSEVVYGSDRLGPRAPSIAS